MTGADRSGQHGVIWDELTPKELVLFDVCMFDFAELNACNAYSPFITPIRKKCFLLLQY